MTLKSKAKSRMSSLIRAVRLLTLSTLSFSLISRRASFYTFADNHMPRTEITGRNLQTVYPDEGKHSATVLVLHGLGDSSDGWIDMAERWARDMPWVKFIVPSAATRPITMNGGYQMPGWYDIIGLDDRAGESCDGIDESIAEIRGIMAAENALGIPYSRMMLTGFSQGGALSLFAGLQMPVEQKLGGILVMSGYCPGYSKFKLTPGLEDVPLMHCHGTSDPVVRHEWAVKTKGHVESLGFRNYELKNYRGMAHSVCDEEIKDALQFLNKCLPDDAAFTVKPKDPSDMSIKELKTAIQRAGLASKAHGFNEKQEYVALLKAHREGNVFL
jgi:lysophospholipase-2